MCGPFVLSQTATRLGDIAPKHLSEWNRLQGAALLPYHAGRTTTYAALGILAALLSAQFKAAAWFQQFSALLLAAAGLVFLLAALRVFQIRLPSFLPSLPVFVAAPLRGLFTRPSGWRGYALGLVLGLLPCGLVYAALMAVAAHGNPLMAATGMAAFAFGTMPALLMVGMGGHFVMSRWRRAVTYLSAPLMVFNSLALFLMAGDLIR